MATVDKDTIVAIATPSGQGGIGIVRLSGPAARQVAQGLTNQSLAERRAHFVAVTDGEDLIDEGIAIFFAEPASFTGEDIVELQLHGSPVVLQSVLDLCRQAGARLARPGEFSERAYLNDKIDLAQAEAIADLIASASRGAARAAVRSLSGAFSQQVASLAERTEHMRMLIEATIDFPEEEEDFLERYSVRDQIRSLRADLEGLLARSDQGRVLNDGASVALIGAPNAGKSSLLNTLAGEEAAIVTDIPGTTRDLLKVDLVLQDLPVRLIDTAGLHETEDPVEREGVARAKREAAEADLVLCLIDATADDWGLEFERLKELVGLTSGADNLMAVVNKMDLVASPGSDWLLVSAKTGDGISALVEAIHRAVGLGNEETEFTARQRHIDALRNAVVHIHAGQSGLDNIGLEILAEELRAAHDALGEIVGKTTADDLLGRIFSQFCIGK